MYLEVSGRNFMFAGKPIRLRGVGLGGWLNLEHFMLGIPGTETEIRDAVASVYGDTLASQFWKTFLDVYAAEADLRYVRDLGLNSVRIPVNIKLLEASDGVFRSAPAIERLDRLISIAERLGLFVILDLHSAPGGQNPDWHCDNATGDYGFWREPVHRAKAIAVWEQLATHYRDSPTVAAYDLINEPCFFEDIPSSVLVDFHAECIAAIRRIDPHHVIFIEGNTYSRDFTMFDRNLDDQVAYSFHYYPFLQIPGALESSTVAAPLGESLYRDVSLTHLMEGLQRPIWCGETGFARHVAGSVPALESFLQIMEGLGISWALWPLKDARAMGLLSPRAQSPWMKLVAEATDHWSFWDTFSQDSIMAAGEGRDRLLFYRRMAEATSNANALFRERLTRIPFERIDEALESFAFAQCDQHPLGLPRAT